MLWLQILLLLLFIYVVIIISKLFFAIYIVRINLKKTIPFNRYIDNSNHYCAVIGDSLAMGLGLSNNSYSLSGLLGRDFSNINIETYAKKGLKLGDLKLYSHILKYILTRKKYKLIIFIVGANDVIRFTPFSEIESDLNDVIKKFKEKADNVIILHGGDVGRSPLFLPPLNWIYTNRTYKLKNIYEKAQEEYNNVYYINLLDDDYSEDFIKNPKNYFSKDLLHVNEKGVEFAYRKILEIIKSNKILFN